MPKRIVRVVSGHEYWPTWLCPSLKGVVVLAKNGMGKIQFADTGETMTLRPDHIAKLKHAQDCTTCDSIARARAILMAKKAEMEAAQ